MSLKNTDALPVSLGTEAVQEVVIGSSLQLESRGNEPSCLGASAFSACVIGIICIVVVLSRDYIKHVLLSLEHNDMIVSFLIFLVLFTAVSFPFAWGYILLNIAAGYLFGLVGGFLIMISCATVGVIIAHVTLRKFCRECVYSRLISSNMRRFISVIDSEHGFKVIALARLTPFPFGLQNAFFAMSDISLPRYTAASAGGMLPCQILHAYFGSTLRSMDEVVSSTSSSSTIYAVFAGQLVMIVAFLAFVIRKAREELLRTVEHCAATPVGNSQFTGPAVATDSKLSLFGYGFAATNQTDVMLDV